MSTPGIVVTRVEARHADALAAHPREWDQCYEQLAPGPFRGCSTELWLGDLQLFREQTSQPLQERGRGRPRTRTFAIPVAARGPLWCAGQALPADAVVSLEDGAEMDFRTSGAADMVAVSCDAAAFAALAREVGGFDADERLRGRALVGCPGRAALAADLAALVDHVTGAAPMPIDGSVHRGLRTAVLETLVAALEPTRALGAERAPAGARRTVAAVRERVEAEPGRALAVSDLCRELGLTRRTLQNHFLAVVGVSPGQWLRALRLRAVRRALLEPATATHAIADLAAAWGFWHLPRFAADYRRMFGETPSSTRRAGGAAQ